MRFDIRLYKIVAHRGLHNMKKGIPENSIGAFEQAARRGLAIELDIHLTLDKKLVVFHDYNLKRMTGERGLIEEKTYEELTGLRLLETAYGIPLLDEVLDKIDGRVPVIMEIKTELFRGELEEILWKRLKHYRGEFVIESFNPFSVLWFKKYAPEVVRGQLACFYYPEISSVIKRFVLRNMLLNGLTKPDFVAYCVDDLSENLRSRLKKKGIGLIAWTVRTKEEAVKAMALCDGLIFEDIAIEELRNIEEEAAEKVKSDMPPVSGS